MLNLWCMDDEWRAGDACDLLECEAAEWNGGAGNIRLNAGEDGAE